MRDKMKVGVFLQISKYISGNMIFMKSIGNLFKDVTYIIDKENPLFDNAIINKNLNCEKEFDLAIGSPHAAAIRATSFKNSWIFIYETPNQIVAESKDNGEENFSYWKEFRNACLKANRVFCISKNTAKYFKIWAGREAEVFYPYVKPIDLGGDEIPGSILSINTNYGHKKLGTIIRCLGYLKYNPNLWLMGEMFGIEKSMPNKYNISIFNGNEIEKYKLLSECEIFVNTSIFEGFGISCVEAASQRKCIVVCDIPVMREVWGDSVYYVRKDNQLDLAKALDLLHFNKKMRREYGEKSFHRYQKRYTFEVAAERMKEIVCEDVARSIQ